MMSRVVLFALFCIARVHAVAHYQFTTVVGAGMRECFYQPVLKGMDLEVIFDVINGNDLDLTLKLLNPDGYIIKQIVRATRSEYRINSTVKGDYGICLDNTYSTLTSKTVFLEVAVDSENEQHKLEFEKDWVDLESPQKIIHAKLDDFTAVKENVIQLYYNNRKSMKLQILFRHREAKDRNIAESNYWTISFWSIVSMVVMSGVFSVQVYMVRNMFTDKRKIRT